MEEYSLKEEREEKELEDLDEFLSGLEPGYMLVVSRVEPGWCKSVLEEIPVTEMSAPISINYLRDTWGGHKLRLRFRGPDGKWVKHRDVNLYSFQPLIYGQPIDRSGPNPHIQRTEPHDRQIQTVPIFNQPATQTDSKKEILELLQVMQSMRAADMQAMASLIGAREPVQSYPDPYRMMSNAFALFSQFQSMRSPESVPKNENDEIMGLLGKLADMFGKKEPGPMRLTPPTPDTSSDMNNDSQKKIDFDLAKQLSGLEPTDALDTFRRAVLSMPAEKQAQTMSALLGSIEEIGGTEVLLSGLEQRGILSVDDESETDDNENPGGESGTNA